MVFMRGRAFIAVVLLLGTLLLGCVQQPQETKDSALYSLINTDDVSGVIYGEAYEEGIKELQSLSPLAIPANLNLIKNLRFVVTMPTLLMSSASTMKPGSAQPVTPVAAIPVMISAAETPLGAKEFTMLTQAFGGGFTGMGVLQNGSATFVEKKVLGRTIEVFDTSTIAGPGTPGIDMVCVWKEGNELISVSTLNCTGYIERNLGKGSKEKFTDYIKSALDLKDKLQAKGKLFGIGAISIKGTASQAGEGGANAFGDANADYLQMLMKSPSIAQQSFYCSGSKETRGGREYCVDKPSGAPVNLLTITTKVGNHGLIMLVAVKGDESAAKEAALAALDAAKLEGEPAKIESTAANPKGEYHTSATVEGEPARVGEASATVIVPTPVAAQAGAEQEALAKCLTQKGWGMYGVDTCPWCAKQKQEFGSAFKGVKYVNCAADAGECRERQITSYPTWISADGVKQSGFRTLAQLREMSGC